MESQWNKLGSKLKGHLHLSSGTHWGQMCALKSPGLSSKDPPMTWKNWHLWLSKGRDNLPDPENPGPCDTHAHILDCHVYTHSHPHAYRFHAHLYTNITLSHYHRGWSCQTAPSRHTRRAQPINPIFPLSHLQGVFLRASQAQGISQYDSWQTL